MEDREFSQEIIDKFPQEEIDRIAAEMREEIEVKDRTYHFKKYETCFVGKKLVNWLIEKNYAETVEDAVQIGDYFMTKNVFHHVLRDHAFKNKNLFYRFEEHERNRGYSEAKDNWHDVLQDREGDLLTPEEQADVLSGISDWPQKNSVLHDLLLDGHNRDTLNNCRPLNWVDPEADGVYDMIAIGGGAGGLVSSIGAALAGGKAALIEKNIMGGDCLNTGCVPSKAFIKSAKVAHTVQNASKYGVEIKGKVKIDFAKVMERMREIRAQISEHDSVYKFVKKYGIDIYLGEAEFTSKKEVSVNGKVLQFSKWWIATGGRANVPKVDGLTEFPYFTNHNVFDITEQPKNLVIIGAGPIGCELGQSFARFGTNVTMISRGGQFLPKEDLDAAAYLHQQMIDDGVNISLNTTPIRVETLQGSGSPWSPGAEFEMEIEKDGQREIIKGDSILIATGRKPNVLGLGLEEAGVEYDEVTGVKVNDYCQTTNSNIYSVGDVCSPYQFTHNSDHMARNAVKNSLFFGKEKTSSLIMSWATYTEPEIAHVGKYPHEMDEEGIEYDTYKVDIGHNDRAICDSVDGFVKIHCKKGSDKIIGSTIVGGPAGDMICSVASAMYNKVGLSTFGAVVHPYPTYGEAFKALTGQINLKKLGPGTKTALRTLLKVKR